MAGNASIEEMDLGVDTIGEAGPESISLKKLRLSYEWASSNKNSGWDLSGRLSMTPRDATYRTLCQTLASSSQPSPRGKVMFGCLSETNENFPYRPPHTHDIIPDRRQVQGSVGGLDVIVR